jgi:hypothetical protein
MGYGWGDLIDFLIHLLHLIIRIYTTILL